MDIFAYQSNGKISDDDTSSYSSSMEALQCVIALPFVFGLWYSKFDYNLLSYTFHIISTILWIDSNSNSIKAVSLTFDSMGSVVAL
jgi:hypothetical protein